MAKTTNILSGALSGAGAGAQVGGPWGAAGGAVLGGLLGGQGGEDESAKYQREMMARLQGINVPSLADLQFTPEELQYMGDLSPDQLQSFVLEKSSMENVAVDPRLKTEQMKALDKVSQLADRGFSDEDMMAFNVARQQAAGEAQAKQGQILQNMQQRGQGGSGAELIARLQQNDNSTNQLSLEQQKQAMAQAEARKSALTMLANQSGSMRNQDFAEQSDVARAKDVVNNINFRNQQQNSNANTDAANNAKLRNLNSRQQTSNQNVDIRNQGQQNNRNQLTNKFNMDIAKATGQNRVSSDMADNSIRQSGNNSSGIGQIGQGLIQIAPTLKNTFGTKSVAQQDDDALDELTK